jgi:hypothetical protein
MRKAVFVDLPNFYSRLLKSGLGEPRELRDYFLHWLDLDLVSKWLAGEFCPTWVFYSGRRFGPSSERIEGQHLDEYIKRISRLTSVTPYDVNIPGDQREAFMVKCECGKTIPGQWESEKGVDASLIVHLFDTADSWDEAVLLSGDADFAPAVRALRRQGKIVSGAGFANVSECLVRELYGFQDLSSEILRSDLAAYLLFGKGQLITRWMKDDIVPQEAVDAATNIKFTCEWESEERAESSALYSGGQRFLIEQYAKIVFGSQGMAKRNSRMSLLEDFRRRFPELTHDLSILLVNPLVWERVARILPGFLRAFSGASSGSVGHLETIFMKHADGGFVRKCDA